MHSVADEVSVCISVCHEAFVEITRLAADFTSSDCIGIHLVGIIAPLILKFPFHLIHLGLK